MRSVGQSYRLHLSLIVLLTATLWSTTSSAADSGDAGGETNARPQVAGYDGDFFIQSPEKPFKLEIGGRLQSQYRYANVPDPDDGRTFESSFRVRRARLKLAGYAFSENLKFKFQPDFSGGAVELLDFYLDYGAVPGVFQVRAGQWRIPFFRQQINSSGKLQLVGRTLTEDFFGEDYDIGVAVHNGYGGSPTFEWVAGVFNGTGTGTRTVAETTQVNGDEVIEVSTVNGGEPAKFQPATVVRFGYNHGGLDGYSEADLEGGPFRFGLGLSGISRFDLDGGDDARVKGTIDYVVKAHGFSSTGGFHLSTVQTGDGFGDQDLEALGFHGQLGYVIGGMYEPSARYAMLDPDGDDNTQQEILGGFSVYFEEHSLKWQTDGGVLLEQTGGEDTTSALIRTQLQLSL